MAGRRPRPGARGDPRIPLLPPGVRQAGLGRVRRTRRHRPRRRRTEHPRGHGRAGRRVLPGPVGTDQRPRAGLPPGHGRARSGPGAARARWRRCSDGPATALGSVRDGLLKKSLCYSPRWGEIEFTVPMFDEFMRAVDPRPRPAVGLTGRVRVAPCGSVRTATCSAGRGGSAWRSRSRRPRGRWRRTSRSRCSPPSWWPRRRRWRP